MASFMPIGPTLWALEGQIPTGRHTNTLTHTHTHSLSFITYIPHVYKKSRAKISLNHQPVFQIHIAFLVLFGQSLKKCLFCLTSSERRDIGEIVQ